MKKIKMFFQQLLFNISLSISQTDSLEYWVGNKTQYSFFLNLGPKMLIIRNRKVYFRGSAFSVKAEVSKDGKVVYCRPMCLHTEKGDRVFYGKEKVDREYRKLEQWIAIDAGD